MCGPPPAEPRSRAARGELKFKCDPRRGRRREPATARAGPREQEARAFKGPARLLARLRPLNSGASASLCEEVPEGPGPLNRLKRLPWVTCAGDWGRVDLFSRFATSVLPPSTEVQFRGPHPDCAGTIIKKKIFFIYSVILAAYLLHQGGFICTVTPVVIVCGGEVPGEGNRILFFPVFFRVKRSLTTSLLGTHATYQVFQKVKCLPKRFTL